MHTTRLKFFFVSTGLLAILAFSSFTGNGRYSATDTHDLSDTVIIAKLRRAALATDTQKANQPAMITVTGVVCGKKTVFWYSGLLHIVPRCTIANVLVGTSSGEYKTKTDTHGRFTLTVPANTSEIETVRHGCWSLPFGYSYGSVLLKNVSAGKPAKIELTYWMRPGMRICPCF